jgi:ElaB/YqjD/DUF883 family membrane-anchored ribosome-binding protein
MKRIKSLTRLVNEVEELLAELQDEHAPEVQELRDRVEESIGAAKRAIRKERRSVTARVGQYAKSADRYISDYPRLAFLSGALIFGMIGYLAGANSRWFDKPS